MWTNNQSYSVEDGLDGLTENQTKLASYWNTPFNEICLGMKVNDTTEWIKIQFNASSFLDLITVGGNTTAGKAAWKSLITGSKLQDRCYEEGFKMKGESIFYGSLVKVRFGILADNREDCVNPDSCIGFGITARGCNKNGIVDPIKERKTTCGNLAVCGYFDNIDIPAFGYILVK